MYRLTFKRQAAKALVRLPGQASRRIRDQLDKLSENPNRADIDIGALSGRDGYRLRVGGTRVIFELDHDTRLITVLRIAPRSQVYKK